MKNTNLKNLVFFTVLALGFAACNAETSLSKNQTMESNVHLTDSSDSQVVVIVKVKAPWYAFQSVLKGKFKDALPDYQKLDGLAFKAFSTIKTEQGKYYGGIYLWESRAKATNWFSPKWFADVKEKRGVEANVAYFDVIHFVNFVATDFDHRKGEDSCVTIFIHKITEDIIRKSTTPQTGLLRTYIIKEAENQQGALLLFAHDKAAENFIKENQIINFEKFETPVLLNNSK